MLKEVTIAEQILEMVEAHPDCTLDELTEYLPEWSWPEVFLEVDHLSRAGGLRLTQSDGGFITTIQAV